jgi:hypothetical protein
MALLITEPHITIGIIEEKIHLATEENVITLDVKEQGTTGPKGDKGDQGEPGATGPPGSGGDLTYVHNQLIPSDEWTITHSLGKFPSVQTTDSAGTVTYGDVLYESNSVVIVRFGAAFGGRAYLN